MTNGSQLAASETDDFESTTDPGGLDLVVSAFTYSFFENPGLKFVENLTFVGANVVSGDGNDLDNVITGNAAFNDLRGRGGNDTLIGNGDTDQLVGGAGNDTLWGGAGNDSLFGDNIPPNGVGGLDAAIYSDVLDAITVTLSNGTNPGSATSSAGGNPAERNLGDGLCP